MSIEFYIDPSAVREALLTNRCLFVKIHGDRLQYRKVSVEPCPSKLKPSDEAQARSA